MIGLNDVKAQGSPIPCNDFVIQDFEQSASLTLVTPRNADSEKAFEELGDTFGAGTLFPYVLLATVPDNAPNNFDNCYLVQPGEECYGDGESGKFNSEGCILERARFICTLSNTF